MIKIHLKWSVEHETTLRNLFLNITQNNLDRKDNTDKFKKIETTLLDFSIKLNTKYKKLEDIDLDKHKELANRQMLKVKNWASKQFDYIETTKDTDITKKINNNAKFRARDFKGTYYSTFLNEIVSEDSEYFQWETMGDNRVRDEHMDRELEIYKFEDADLLPGEDPGCRCWASAYFPDEWEMPN